MIGNLRENDGTLERWLKCGAFVGFIGFGLIIGSIIHFLTMTLNPDLSVHFMDTLILFLYVSFFYGVTGAIAGLVMGLLTWKAVSVASSQKVSRFLGGIIITLLVLIPFAWAISTPHASRALSAFKEQLIHPISLGSLAALAAISALLLAIGYLIMPLFYSVKRLLRTASILCALVFPILLLLSQGLEVSPQDNASGMVENDFSITGTGIKFVLIGLDGADWDIIKPLEEEGKLPGFSRLMNEGVTVDLKTFVPTLSPALWTSIATGVSPETHGIRSFYITALPFISSPIRSFPSGLGLNFRLIPLLNRSGLFPPLIKMCTSNMKQNPSIWNILDSYGRSAGIIDYFITWPADSVRGFVISDLLMRHVYEFGLEDLESADGLVFPEELGEDVKEILSDIRPEAMGLDFMKDRVVNKDCTLERDNSYLRLISRRIWRDEALWRLSHTLYEEYRPDLLMTYTSAIDGTNHVLGQFIYEENGEGEEWNCLHDCLELWYRYEDKKIRELMEILDDSTCVVIVSDHGFEETKGHHENGPDGILLLWGAGVSPGAQIDDAGLMDIVPTILALAGYPIANDLEGRVLEDAISSELLQTYPLNYIDSYGRRTHGGEGPIKMDPALEKQIREELKALGYIK